jgi:uncharacterized protein (TIGR02444 family)
VGETQLRLWPFSLAVYHDDAVQKECLDLQDRHGIDTNMLLFCAFVGAAHGAVISEHDVREALSLIAAWNANVVRALRQVRRELKLFADPSPIQIAAGELRTSVNAAELAAEQIEQAMLETFTATRLANWQLAEPASAAAANVRTLLTACGDPAPSELPIRLLAAALAAPIPQLVRNGSR